MRIFAASLATETNSFSPIPTSRESYENTLYFPPGKHPDRGTLYWHTDGSWKERTGSAFCKAS